jgi:hypothetical protein
VRLLPARFGGAGLRPPGTRLSKAARAVPWAALVMASRLVLMRPDFPAAGVVCPSLRLNDRFRPLDGDILLIRRGRSSWPPLAMAAIIRAICSGVAAQSPAQWPS